MKMDIHRIKIKDFSLFWPTFKTIVEAADTYSISPRISFDEAFEYWCLNPQVTYVAKKENRLAGSYYLKSNADGPGSHICNCGYMVGAEFRGQGVARLLCQHSQQIALELGYEAMQFNAVVSTNEGAIYLWKSLGFSIIGTIPNAFNHKQLGMVDSYIMYKALNSG